jgi:hypothetical protein
MTIAFSEPAAGKLVAGRLSDKLHKDDHQRSVPMVARATAAYGNSLA